MSSPVRAPRVLIVDDQALLRSGLMRLLQKDQRVKVVGETGDAQDAVRKVASLEPDVVLMDLTIPNFDGIQATRRIMTDHPEARVLILTSIQTDSYILQAHRAGASGYVLKDLGVDAIVSSILAVAAGEWVMSESVASRLLEMLTETEKPKAYNNALTMRELEILTMLSTGMANKEIAYKLKISHKTVRNHVSNMYEKLRISDRSQAVLYAIRKGLIKV
ncbi:MAG: DNA-binding response regulator [Candidatus Nephthysia bennettiae]|uniref:response regulator n=1 Tax=Candidatus Nephthysia bennettiae TaxID=3127016 RepID=UPI000DB3A57A|nr:MAG: DNA-binding response regulator [Candidatus Dormibacteraeota bacterium]